jgi:3-hydroxyisobutyrate dehydrogenase-like beta-hydroxyacid dehydrogenase
MGRAAAARLRESGFDVRGWNRSPVVDAPVPVFAELAAAATADVSLLYVADPGAVADVLAALEPHLPRGHVVLDRGTSDPAASRAHAARLAAGGVGWVDAPASGEPTHAREGRLTVMAGGEDSDVARVRPLLEALGAVEHVGGPGAGHTTKLVNQVVVALAVEAVAEALALAERVGVDPRLVQRALRGGTADSRVLHVHGTRMIERRYVPGGKVTTLLKDVRLACALAASVDLELPHAGSVAARFEALAARGDGDLDCSALHALLAQEPPERGIYGAPEPD